MTKQLLWIVSVLIFFSACWPRNTQESSIDKTSSTIVGADKDAHGCIGSAGYTWSELKQKCIRIFEDGMQMTTVDSSLDQTLAAYIVFNADSSKGELFIPINDNKAILNRIAIQTWSDGTYFIYHSDKHFELRKGDVTLYKSR